MKQVGMPRTPPLSPTQVHCGTVQSMQRANLAMGLRWMEPMTLSELLLTMELGRIPAEPFHYGLKHPRQISPSSKYGASGNGTLFKLSLNSSGAAVFDLGGTGNAITSS